MNDTKVASRIAFFTVTVAATILLAGCGDKPGAGQAASPGQASPVAGAPAAPNSSGARDEPQLAAKLNTYVDGYNQLVGTFSLKKLRDHYFNLNIPAKDASGNISLSGFNSVALATEKIKKARALPSADLAELDTAADALTGSLDKLVAQLKELDVYYDSKAYKDDQLARGKAEDAAVRANFDASTVAMRAFDQVLDREQKKRDVEKLERLKVSGDMLGYHTKLALQEADQLVNLFDSESDVKNPAKYEQGDKLVAGLEKTLAAQRELYAAAKAEGRNPDSGYESAASSLVLVIGGYREMKQSKDARQYNSMIERFNRAIESANRIRQR